MYDGLTGGDLSKKKHIRKTNTYEVFEWEELRRWKFYNDKLRKEKDELRRKAY
jgi:hypothetical protein